MATKKTKDVKVETPVTSELAEEKEVKVETPITEVKVEEKNSETTSTPVETETIPTYDIKAKHKSLKNIVLEPTDSVKNGEVIVSVKNLKVQFSVRNRILTAIRNISLDIYKGEILAIVGESGSGKSVFTKTLTGMLEANGGVSQGKILYSGVDLATFHTNEDWLNIRGKRIATIFQDPMTSLDPLRRIGSQISEVIRLHRGMNKEDAKAEAISLLKKVGIVDAENRYNDYPFQYSGGMRQRVVIAIALACAPDILICDEPTTALDVTIQAQILELIKELKKEYGFTVLFITHDLGVVAEVADRVAVMYAGQIIEYGTVNDIYYNPQHPYTWALLSSLPQLGEKGETLYSITGTPPSLFNEIKGDAFAPRNPYALQIDFVKEPPMFKVSETHYAKTWLLDPRAPKVKRPEIIGQITERVAKIYSNGGEDNE
jgi:oligopeptide transport system ATP-binding protein